VILDLIFVAGGIVMLYYGGNWLVEGASRLARSFGISALVVGLTVVAFGTSVPELLVSVSAALSGTSDVSIGNVIGSNIANIGLILGATGLVFPIVVRANLIRREIPILIAITLGAAFIFYDGTISRLDGASLLIGLIVFNAAMLYFSRRDRETQDFQVEEDEYEAGAEKPITAEQRPRELVRLLLGLVVLAIGAQLTVDGAVSIARSFGISELVIGITLIAVGTSLPELATSIIAALNKQSDIAIGNVVGSNVYNLLSILGLTALIRPISMINPYALNRTWSEIVANPIALDFTTYHQVTRFDGPIMMAFTLLLLPIAINRKISRLEAVLLLIGYFAFSAFAVLR